MLCSTMHRPRLIGYLSLLRRSPTSSCWRMNLGDLTGQTGIHTHIAHTHTQRSHIHGIIMALEHTKVDVSQWRTMSKDMEVRKRSGCKKVPVGVFEAYVSLLDFVVLQFGHVIFIHWRLSHGLLEISQETIEKQYLSLVIKSFDVF